MTFYYIYTSNGDVIKKKYNYTTNGDVIKKKYNNVIEYFTLLDSLNTDLDKTNKRLNELKSTDPVTLQKNQTEIDELNNLVIRLTERIKKYKLNIEEEDKKAQKEEEAEQFKINKEHQRLENIRVEKQKYKELNEELNDKIKFKKVIYDDELKYHADLYYEYMIDQKIKDRYEGFLSSFQYNYSASLKDLINEINKFLNNKNIIETKSDYNRRVGDMQSIQFFEFDKFYYKEKLLDMIETIDKACCVNCACNETNCIKGSLTCMERQFFKNNTFKIDNYLKYRPSDAKTYFKDIFTNRQSLRKKEISRMIEKDKNEKLTFQNEYNKAITDKIDPTNQLKSLQDQYELLLNQSIEINNNLISADNNIVTLGGEFRLDRADLKINTTADKYPLNIESRAYTVEIIRDTARRKLLNKISDLRELKIIADKNFKEKTNATNKRIALRIAASTASYQTKISKQRINANNETHKLQNVYNKAIDNGINITDEIKTLKDQYTKVFNTLIINNTAAEKNIKIQKNELDILDIIDSLNEIDKTRSSLYINIVDNIKKIILNKYKEDIKIRKIKDDNEKLTLHNAYNKAISDNIDRNNILRPLQDQYEAAFDVSIKANIAAENAMNSIKTIDDENNLDDNIIQNAKRLELERDKNREILLDNIIELTELKKEYDELNEERKKDIIKKKINDENEKLTLRDLYNKALVDGIDKIDPNRLKLLQDQYEAAFNKSIIANVDAENAINSIKTIYDENYEKNVINMIDNADKLENERYDSKDNLFNIITDFTELTNLQKEFDKRYAVYQEDIKKQKIKDDDEKLNLRKEYNIAIGDGIDPTNKLKPLQNQYETAFNISIKANIDAENAINSIKTMNDEPALLKLINTAEKLKIEKDNLKEKLLNTIIELTQEVETAVESYYISTLEKFENTITPNNTCISKNKTSFLEETKLYTNALFPKRFLTNEIIFLICAFGIIIYFIFFFNK